MTLGGVASAQAAPSSVWGSVSGTVTASGLVAAQTTANQAQQGAARAAQRLSFDQKPRGSPASIAADQEAVKLAQQAAQQATAKLSADRAQSALVDVLA